MHSLLHENKLTLKLAFPFGLWLGYSRGMGVTGFWIRLGTGLGLSALFMSLRLRWLLKQTA